MKLGTILPTAASLKTSDIYAYDLALAQSVVADAKMSGYTRENIGGEFRYYKTPKLYAIVSRNLNVLWFEVRPDGDYPIANVIA